MHEDITEHISREDGYNRGFEEGKKYAQNKVLELMNEVETAYKLQHIRMESGSAEESKHKLNAIRYMKSWVLSGGHTDFDGNRVCLPW